ncbi:ABC transporter permease [Immundisolibacter sp.]|uniref:ABC transporter permease n=1 Tax=Immundisolibacter sp. TaxID=1934948 RepID=UPI002634EF1F|nr:ABC transporter permease [Immundisolibacter sp.]MDD3651009.1 ABC transporter permease [Immundisolibacter sp.]
MIDNWPGLWTLLVKEVKRFTVVFMQTVTAPVVSALLYLFIFSHALGGRVDVYPGVSYPQFLVPGLMMMTIIQNAFANTSSSLIFSKVTGNIVFVLLAPLSHLEFYLGFVGAALVRALVVCLGVYAVAFVYLGVTVVHPLPLLAFGLLGGLLLATCGLLTGIWADKFDQVATVQNFLILPLTYLSGVFYSIHSLPPGWQAVSRANPFFYLIDGFRYAFFGHSDVSVWQSLAVMAGANLALCILCVRLLARGYKLRG